MSICKQGKKKDKMSSFLEKKRIRKCNVGAKFCSQADKKLKEKPDAKWLKGNGNPRVRPHPAKFPTGEKKSSKA